MQQPHSGNGAAPGLTDLFRRLADDASALVRGEVALAKLEMREAARGLVRDSSKLAIAFALAWFGGIALTAAAVIGVAHLLGGRFGVRRADRRRRVPRDRRRARTQRHACIQQR